MKALLVEHVANFAQWAVVAAISPSLFRGVYRSYKQIYGFKSPWETILSSWPARVLAVGLVSLIVRICGVGCLAFPNASEGEIAFGTFLLSYTIAIGIGLVMVGEWIIPKIAEILIYGPLLGAIGGTLLGSTLGLVLDTALGGDSLYTLISMALCGLLGAKYLGQPVFQYSADMISRMATWSMRPLFIVLNR